MSFGTLEEALGDKDFVTKLAEQNLPVLHVRLWPFWMNDASRILSAHGYRLRHISDSHGGDKGRDLIYDTVWEKTS